MADSQTQQDDTLTSDEQRELDELIIALPILNKFIDDTLKPDLKHIEEDTAAHSE